MEVISFLQSFSSDILNLIMMIVTSFGSLYFIMFFILLIYWCYNKEIGYKLALIISCSMVLNSIVKGLVQTPRPIGVEGIVSIGTYTALGYSFPSGHTQNITTFGTSLFIFTKNKLMFIISVILMVLVAISRLYLGLHWPVDILGGLILALIVSISLNELFIKLNSFKINILIALLILIFSLGFLFISKDKMGYDYFNSMGLISGIYLGHLFERRFVNFSPSSSNTDNIMKLIIGSSTVILIEVLFKYLFVETFILLLVKYFIIGFWVIGIIPFIFKLTNLYYREAYEIINIKYRK